MIAVSYYSQRRLKGAYLYMVSLFFLFSFSIQLVQAQDQTDQALSNIAEKSTLSEAALSRMASKIASQRLEKQRAGALTQKTPAQRQFINGIRSGFSSAAADVAYSSSYFDTQAGDDFSFPEDSHDFCRASFDSIAANQDFYLNASLNVGESVVATLTWDTPADYDLYIFDLEGYPVGDTDPLADFDGANGINAQSDLSPPGDLIEEATIVHTRPAADADEFVVVIDRFRGTASAALSLTLTGNDDTFVVLEYVSAQDFSYVNAVTDEIAGALTDGLSINLDDLGSPRPNFNVQFNTDGCAESIVFSLVDVSTGAVVQAFTDDDLPYALFGDTNGDFNAADLAGGNYILTATPFSENDGQGAAAEPQTVAFEIVSSTAPPSVESFTLIDAVNDQPIQDFDPIVDGSSIDLVALDNLGFDISRLNIRANTSDPEGQIEQVNSDLAITLLTGDIETVSNADDGADYSVYGDDNAGDFADASLPLGAYSLTGVPLVAGVAQPSTTVNFTVIGPRISSYTLINADTEQPIDGTGGVPDFDPIPDGAIIDVNAIGTRNINIRGNTIDFTPPIIESAFFERRGSDGIVNTRIESFRPYAVFGDPTSVDLEQGDPRLDYRAWPLIRNASFVLFGQPYGSNGATGEPFGPLTITFTIINASAATFEGPLLEPALLPNYPNPFNPVTAIRFGLPVDSPVRLEVYDMLGRVVKVLVDGTLESGFHEVTFEAGNLSSGMYLYRLETPGTVKIRPMTLLK